MWFSFKEMNVLLSRRLVKLIKIHPVVGKKSAPHVQSKQDVKVVQYSSQLQPDWLSCHTRYISGERAFLKKEM